MHNFFNFFLYKSNFCLVNLGFHLQDAELFPVKPKMFKQVANNAMFWFDSLHSSSILIKLRLVETFNSGCDKVN